MAAKTAGHILLKIGGTDTDLQKVLRRAQARIQAFSKSINKIGGKISGFGKDIGKYVGLASAPLAASVAAFSQMGDGLDKLSGKLGISVEALSEYQFALAQSGTDINVFTVAIKTMSNIISKETGDGVKALNKLGLSIKDLQGLSPEKAFEKIANSLNQVEDEVTKTSVAVTLFGGQGAKLKPLLSSISELRQEARDLNIVMSTDQAKSAASLTDAFGRITSTIKYLTFNIGSALAPIITDIANKIAGLISIIIQWVKDNQELIRTIAKVLAVGGALAAVLITIGTSVSLTAFAVSGLASIFGVLATVAGVVLSPLGLIIAGVLSLADGIMKVTNEGKGLVNFFMTKFQSIYEAVKPVIDSIVSAMKLGELTLAADIAFTGLKIAALSVWAEIRYIFDSGIAYLGAAWDGLTFSFIRAWEYVKRGLSQGWNYLKYGFMTLAGFMQDVFLAGIEGILWAFGKLVDGLLWVLKKLGIVGQETGNIINKAVDGINKIRNDNAKYYKNEKQAIDRDIENTAKKSDKYLQDLQDEQDQRTISRFVNRDNRYQESQDEINSLKKELNGLIQEEKRLASIVKEVTDLPEEKSAIGKAASIKPDTESASIDTVSFSARIASILANNNRNRIDEKQLQALEQIVDNTDDLQLGLA